MSKLKIDMVKLMNSTLFPLPTELQDIIKSYIFVPFDKNELQRKIERYEKNVGIKIWNVKLVRD